MAKSTVTRSNNNIWLIGFPKETISGARLPSGHDVMKNFVFYHRVQKLNINKAAQQVHEQLLPFWVKSRLPVRQKHRIIQKIKDLYADQVRLMKHRKRNNSTDQMNQKEYTNKLSQLFDISHANSEQLIKTDEDRQFLKLQQQSKKRCYIKNCLPWTEWVIINSRVSCRPTTGQCNTFNNIIRLP